MIHHANCVSANTPDSAAAREIHETVTRNLYRIPLP